MNNQSFISRKSLLKLVGTFLIALVLFSGGYIAYEKDTENPVKGEAEFTLSYRFRLTNQGPLNLTFVSIRLALLKSWDPVQTVHSLLINTAPNRTTTDEYDNEFAWYEYESFRVGKSIDLIFNATLTKYILDYTQYKFQAKPYDKNSKEYKLYMAYDPYADNTDPAIINTALELGAQANDILGKAFSYYNFTSSYVRYRLLSEVKGATFALNRGYGDCDEYNTLFIALARSSGIPAIGHSAWFAEFQEGFETTDEGAVAHAYPMFYVEGVGLLPLDPTRGNKNLYDNWLKTDQNVITMTRGTDEPYRLLRYKWIPIAGFNDPTVVSNYTISIQSLKIKYFSVLRTVIFIGLIGFPLTFILKESVQARKHHKEQQKKLQRYLNPDFNENPYLGEMDTRKE